MEAVAIEICASAGFRFAEKVGEGAFKQTFLVQDQSGKNKALKVFRPRNSLARSQRELDAMLRCNHQNIGRLEGVATLHHGGVDYTYTIEEYLGGGTLTKRIAEGLLDSTQLRGLGSALIDAVGHIASRNLVHRDLKPDNILFRNDRITPVIVDFGLVRDLSSSSLTKTWVLQGPGTPFFAAPEQLNNNKDLVDWRTDQFGLGIVLAVCGFGQHPYGREGDGPEDVVGRVIARESPSPEFLEWVHSSGLEPLARMIDPWPVARYRTPELLQYAWNT